MITGTYHLTKAGFETTEIRALIQQRRLQVLVHSCVYYKLNQSLIPDNKWQQWADELVQLQIDYPQIASRVGYHEEFKGFDGSSGFDLPISNPEILNKAYELLRRNNAKRIRIDFSRSR